MASEAPPAFGALLRHYRLQAGLSVQALAEQAGLSLRGVSDLERGVRHRPYPDTVRRLADALGLAAADRTRLVVAAQPSAAAPTSRPVAALPTTLPLSLTSFIGREEEIAQIKARLRTTRLLTLTGTGGVGKTRLALEVARRVQVEYRDGAWLVELAALADPGLIPQAVSQVLGIREQPGQAIGDTLLAFLTSTRLLLVLDNCEHLLDACARLADALLHGCPHLRLVVTSRERLGIAGERTWRVPPLALPDGQRLPPRDALTQNEAVRLFAERAVVVQPYFAVTDENAPAVAQVCTRLDGIPLAIELAAARVRSLPVEQLAQRLDDRFRLLTGGSRTALPRQQTLRATLDWSYDLLTEAERVLLLRLAVFAGGCTIEAAEAVCGGEPLAGWEILDRLTSLVDKSLVIAEAQAAEARYRLLETLRQYAFERLIEAGAEAAARARHRDCFLALAEQAEPELHQRADRGWLTRLEAEHDNLRAALAWCLVHDLQGGLRLAGSLWRFWYLRASLSEGSHWLARVLEVADARAPERTCWRLKAVLGAGVIARSRHDVATALARLEEALALSRELGDHPGMIAALRNLGATYHQIGDYHRALALLEEARSLMRGTGDHYDVAANLGNLGGLLSDMGELQRAQSLLEECLAMGRAIGNRFTISRGLWLLGDVMLHLGDDQQAEAYYAEGLAVAQELGTPWLVGGHQLGQGMLALWRGDTAGAAALLEASVGSLRAADSRVELARGLAGLARVALLGEEPAQAAQLWQESLTLRQGIRDRAGSVACQVGLARVAACRGDAEQATWLLRESLAARRAMGEQVGIAGCLEALAVVAVGQDQFVQVARLLGAAEALRQVLGAPLPPVERPEYAATVQAARTALGEAAFADAWAAGQAMTLEEAIAEALSDEPATPAQVSQPAVGDGQVSVLPNASMPSRGRVSPPRSACFHHRESRGVT